MIGLTSRTTSPWRVTSSRSTPCVAGWWGPKLSVSSSWEEPSLEAPSGSSCSCSGAIVMLCSRRRYSEMVGSEELVGGPPALMPSTPRPRLRWARACSSARPHVLGLVVCEGHGLAAEREIAPLRVALVILGQQDPAQVGMAAEDHAEHVVDLALLVVGGGPAGVLRRAWGDRRDHRLARRHAQLHRDAIDLLHVQQLIQDAQARLLWVVVHAVHARQERVALGAQVREHGPDARRVDDERRALTEVGGVEDGVAELLANQLQPGGIRHRGGPPLCRPRRSARASPPRDAPAPACAASGCRASAPRAAAGSRERARRPA